MESQPALADNDFYNMTRDDIFNGSSRAVEIKINETDMTAHEVWSWTGSEDHYSAHWGDADRLPNGNTIINFGVENALHPGHVTEVSPSGELVWEIELSNETIGQWGSYRWERFFESPIIEFPGLNHNISKGDDAAFLEFSVWNSFRSTMFTDGNIKLFDDESNLLLDKDFKFEMYWQETLISLDAVDLDAVFNLGSEVHEITFVIANDGGLETEITILLEINQEGNGFNLLLTSFIVVTGTVVIATSVVFIRMKKPS